MPDKQWRITLARNAMSATGMTQQQLAERLGISKVQVCRWMHGVRPVPERYLMTMAEMMEGAA